MAIWDLAVYSSSLGKNEAWLAEDSGKVVQLSFDDKLNVSSNLVVHVSQRKL